MGEDWVKTKTIDIRKVFMEKNPAVAKILPRFVYSYLKKIVHQDDINDILLRHGDKLGIEFINAAIKDFNIDLSVEGFERVPQNGRYIFACNHPLGGFDALLLISYINKRFPEIKTLVNDILMNIPNLRPLFIPINKHGKQYPEAAKNLEDLYTSNTQIVTFPAGLVSRKIKGQIIDLVWKKNFINKAVQYKRDIVPVYISGRNTEFFYRLARLRKMFGIKINIEMFYLADETFKHKNKHFEIKFGEPISYLSFDKKRNPAEWAKWVKERVYELNGEKNIPF